jgi:hypothetical protein
MKLVLAASFSDLYALEFSRVINQSDGAHPGCTIQVISDPALPRDLRPTFERIAPGFPIVDPRRFGFDRDSD